MSVNRNKHIFFDFLPVLAIWKEIGVRNEVETHLRHALVNQKLLPQIRRIVVHNVELKLTRGVLLHKCISDFHDILRKT